MSKINDFGEKIGGARKDLWHKDGLTEEHLEELNDSEKAKYVSRDYVWPLPNSKKQVEDGLPVFVAYWQREVRKEIRNFPLRKPGEPLDDVYRRYIRIVRKVKNAVMHITSENEIPDFYEISGKRFGETYEDWNACVKQSFPYLSCNHEYFRIQIQRRNFPEGKARKQTERKKKFIPPQLSHIEREGENYRLGQNINERIWQNEFSFRGVEFGNWLSQKDRQYSMNYCYDALKDLANILDIDTKDVAFQGTLALAFGARGSSSGNAHYEFMRQVINLTKMRGAGATAHEWMHALDDKIARFYGLDCKGTKLASMAVKEYDKLPKEFVSLVKSLSKDSSGNYTDYYRGSAGFDRHFSKDTYGSWASPGEMLARAFGCYVKDCYGQKSDYLIAHADSYVFEFEDQSISAIPQGEEREIFNEMFDRLFHRLKKDGVLHKRQEKPVVTQVAETTQVAENPIPYECKCSVELSVDFHGQYTFQF